VLKLPQGTHLATCPDLGRLGFAFREPGEKSLVRVVLLAALARATAASALEIVLTRVASLNLHRRHLRALLRARGSDLPSDLDGLRLS
jgi:hypothetical protein